MLLNMRLMPASEDVDARESLARRSGLIIGAAGTPYEGGYFRIRFNFGPEYPNVPPKCELRAS
jgi:ubiquitin-protein ligase